MKKFLGLQEVANILGMPKQNVQMHIRTSTFPSPAMYVGTRSGWAIEQIEDYAKIKNDETAKGILDETSRKKNPKFIDINTEAIAELSVKYQEEPPKELPPYYYLGMTEVGNLLGWQPAKVKVYSDRDNFPLPVASIGERKAWSFSQITRYARMNGIELANVPNENLVEVVLEISEKEVWKVKPTYTGKWLATKEAVEIKETSSKFKGKNTVVRRTSFNQYDIKLFAKRDDAVAYLLEDAIEQRFEYGIQPAFEKDMVKLGGLVPVAFRYTEYKVLPKEKAVALLEDALKADFKKIALENYLEGNLHGVCAFDLRKGEIVSYGATVEVYPPLQAVIVLYWIDKDTAETHELLDSVAEQMAMFY